MTDANRPDPFSRREFLSSGLLLASAAASIPAFLNRSALAMHAQAAGLSSVPAPPPTFHVMTRVRGPGLRG